MSGVDLINRDPNDINSHLKCAFEDVLAEPEGAHSIDCVWKLSYICFNCWKDFCYKLCTLCCGWCIAAQLGCTFANIAFQHIWNYTPLMRQMTINCGCMKKIWGLCISCCLDPLCESCGLLFHAFRKN